jgi:predicted nucleic acid-binding protein
MRAARCALDLRLRGADAVYVAVAHSLQVPLITWDREQLTRAAGRIAVRTP